MNKDLKVPIIIVLVIAIISLGVAFAAFNSTLVINGTASVDEATWDIVFEGLDSEHPTVLGSPTIPQGSTASVITAPTINNNSTDISTYSVTLSAPGDSITYNFKIHNKGTIAARVTNLDIKQGIYLTTNTSRRTSDADTLNNIEYKLYYTEGNAIIGNDLEKDCLAPGEEELVSLRIIFLPSDDESVLPSTDLLLDNLGVTITYTSETSCAPDSGGGNSGGGNGGGNNDPFQNITGNFLISNEWDNNLEDWALVWSNDVQDLYSIFPNGYPPTTYIKKINNIPNVCIYRNDMEYCFDKTQITMQNAESTLRTFCNAVNGNFYYSASSGDFNGSNSTNGYSCKDSLEDDNSNLYEDDSYNVEIHFYDDEITGVYIDANGPAGNWQSCEVANGTPPTYCTYLLDSYFQ